MGHRIFGVYAYLRLHPGLRMNNTLHQTGDENLQNPAGRRRLRTVTTMKDG